MRIVTLFGRVLLGFLAVAPLVGTVAAYAMKRRLETVDAPEADAIKVVAIFEPISFRSTATTFRGGTVDCWYGGGVIDLRDATLDPAGARLDVRAIFGGGQILVPETWQVSASVLGIGGFADARSKVDRAADAPHLRIDGVAIFGGFVVMSELPKAEEEQLAVPGAA